MVLRNGVVTCVISEPMICNVQNTGQGAKYVDYFHNRLLVLCSNTYPLFLAPLCKLSTSSKVTVSFPNLIGFFNCLNPANCTASMGFTQSLREMITRDLPWVKGWQLHKPSNLTVICVPVV
jgi:hypothetical protein